MRILMFSPYPPDRCGIASYARQEVESLRQRGNEVTVASPEPSDAEYLIDISVPGSGRELAKLARGFDRLLVQFHPTLLGGEGGGRSGRGRSLVRLARGMRAAPSSEVRVHEVSYGEGRSAPLVRLVLRSVWRQADVVTVHTELEREDFARAFRISRDRIGVVGQHEYLVRRTDADRSSARAELGLPENATVFLAIGFLQPHKGFDRAVRAFGQLGSPQARLYVVGSTWRDDSASRAYTEELRALTDETPGAELREGYVDDLDFDRWIIAADALVLPYRTNWSSAVMERGLLYERPVIMARAGGIAEQGSGRGVSLVDSDAELVEALRAAE